MKLDPKQIKVTDLNGKALDIPAGRILGNVLYEIHHDLDYLEDAIKLNKEEAVEARPGLIQAIDSSLRSPICGVPLSIKKAIIDYLKTLK